MKNITKILISIALASFLSSCAKKNKNNDSTPLPTPEAKSTISADSRKTTSDIIYKNTKIGEISQLEIPSDEIEKQVAKFKNQNLSEITVSPSFNVSVYKSGTDETPQYTIAPKVFAYGLLDSSHRSREANGYISMQINLALIDGVTSELHVDSNTLIIPESLRLKNHDSLKQYIAGLEHKKMDSVEILSGCPTRIVVSTADSSYDITPINIADKIYCQINTPVNFEFKIPEDSADKIFAKALPANGVSIKVDYAIKYSIETKKFQLIFNKEKLLPLIKTLTTSNKSSESKDQLASVLSEILNNSEVDDSLAETFKEQLSTIALKTKEELTNIQTLTKNELNFSWKTSRDFNTDTVINIGSKLKQVSSEEAFLGRDPQFGTNNNAEFTNLNKKNIYSVSLVPQRGYWIEFHPTMYLLERRKRDAEAHIFHDVKFRCKTINNQSNCLIINSRDKFTQEYTGNDMWVKTAEPFANWNQSLAELKLFFQFSNGESFVCSMDDLELKSNETTILIKINNTERCPLFNSGRKVITSFGMINAVNLGDIKYIAGERFVSFNFEEENYNTYKETTYSPEVRLAGKLKLIGQSFITDSVLK